MSDVPFHTKVGVAVTGVAAAFGVDPAYTLGLVGAFAILWELYQGDLDWRDPLGKVSWQGWDDVLDFLPAPALYLLLQRMVTHTLAYVISL